MGKKNKETPKICMTCDNCMYIGEGDFICDVGDPIIVMEDYMPNDNHICCGTADWVDKDED